MIALEKNVRPESTQIADYYDPVVMLVKGNRRTENHLHALERACESLWDGTRDEKLSAYFALDLARAHFAGPDQKHVDDEELSLFPRLRERGHSIGSDVIAALDELESQHRTAELLLKNLESHLAGMPRDGSATFADLDELNQLVAMLAALYRPHLNIENELIYPIAARTLSPSELQQIGQEMRARRCLTLKRL